MTARTAKATDPKVEALREMRRWGESVADSLDAALGAQRADAAEDVRAEAVNLCVRRAERFCRLILEHAARLPR